MGLWATAEAVVQMDPTTFRTYTLPLLGTDSAIQITPASKHFQRVVLAQSAGATPIFISAVASELNTAGQPIPGGAFQFPGAIGGDPIVVVLAPGQHLTAAAALAGTRLAVSVSQAVPAPTKPIPAGVGKEPTTFRTYALPAVGTQAVQVAPSGAVPKRVVMRVNAGAAFISPDVGDLNIVQATPGNAFEMIAAGLFSATFIIAPGQELSASADFAGRLLSVSVSDILPTLPRGPTGTPGASGEE